VLQNFIAPNGHAFADLGRMLHSCEVTRCDLFSDKIHPEFALFVWQLSKQTDLRDELYVLMIAAEVSRLFMTLTAPVRASPFNRDKSADGCKLPFPS